MSQARIQAHAGQFLPANQKSPSATELETPADRPHSRRGCGPLLHRAGAGQEPGHRLGWAPRVRLAADEPLEWQPGSEWPMAANALACTLTPQPPFDPHYRPTPHPRRSAARGDRGSNDPCGSEGLAGGNHETSPSACASRHAPGSVAGGAKGLRAAASVWLLAVSVCREESGLEPLTTTTAPSKPSRRRCGRHDQTPEDARRAVCSASVGIKFARMLIIANWQTPAGKACFKQARSVLDALVKLEQRPEAARPIIRVTKGVATPVKCSRSRVHRK